MLPVTRRQVEAQIDALIDLLDTLDTDPDLEPSLGWTQPSGHYLETPDQLLANANAGDDREDDDEREPDVDGEPSLAATETFNQASAAYYGHPYTSSNELEDGVGAVRKPRPKSKTGGKVLRGCAVLI
jgi:hypothetical protein